MGNIVEQISDAPCNLNLFGGLEMRTLVGIGWDACRINDAECRVIVCTMLCCYAAQALPGFRALVVEAMGKVVRN